jgi:hypothetical protein
MTTPGEIYKNTLVSSQINCDLYSKYLAQKTDLQNKLLNVSTNNTTDSRKSYYEQEVIQNLKGWNKLFMLLFTFLAVGLSIALFLAPNSLSIFSKIAIISALFFYNYYTMYFAKKIMKLFSYITIFIPKNIYKSKF